MPETFAGGRSEASVDLTNCDREPIQFLGRVQSFGCLISVTSDWMIAHASSNCAEILGVDTESLIGRMFSDVIVQSAVHHLRTQFQVLVQNDTSARSFGIDLFGDGRVFDVSIHRSGRTLIFEIEPHLDDGEGKDESSVVRALIARIRRKDNLKDFLSEAARCLQALLDMKRVMVYRFEEDGSGTVVAESLNGEAESYLGLRYPASDIPKQARALYERSPIRIIGDVNGETFPIHPELSPAGEPLDLSFAITRAVSPIHIEYLQNMGVEASLSVSILRRGKLWGLFSCHHDEAFFPNCEKRTAVELFVQLFNYELAQFETDREMEDVEKARDLHDRLMSQMSSGSTLIDIFEAFSDDVNEVIPFDGMAVYSDGVYRSIGSAPTAEEFLGVARFLNTSHSSGLLALDQISARYDMAESFSDRVAGLLALPISRTPRDYLVLFRREIVQSVTWAGNPEKPVKIGENGIRLTPRKSFEAWQEMVRGKSAPWKEREMRTAETLRVTLLEVVLKLADEANLVRKRAQEQQELLIAELNHRVRNILNLIRGLVSQGRGDVTTLEEFGRVLDSRIHSLARAHDQLTDRNWSWVSLETLIRTEVDAFISAKSARVQVAGEDVDLSPAAFTTMALVIHELVTNSAKYGSLSDSSGEVAIELDLRPSGELLLSWVETKGPPVKAPKRKGFGTTIIERSVPYELKGKADVKYELTGLKAEFMIPANHVSPSTSAAEVPKPVETFEASSVALTGPALVVEDNMIIAMEASDMLKDFGATTVVTTSGVAHAMKELEANEFAIALLDVNLGDETSLAIAERCAERSIPIVLATGYGADETATSQFPKVPVLRKPYSQEQMQVAVSKAFEAAES